MATVHENSRGATQPKEAGCGPCLLLQAAAFGLAFGFLLQKGGVAKYEVLIGVLLLKDFTVIKVMGSAIVFGMIGVLTMHRFGMVQLHLKPTRYAANVIGGLIFGVGFGLAGYCPGTGAAALGQGNFDAIAVIAGMMAGSYLFAEASGWLGKTVNKWGERGEMRLPDLVRPSQTPIATSLALAVLAGLLLLKSLSRD
jgi:uncharacterized membrane protein YedE/YeeE